MTSPPGPSVPPPSARWVEANGSHPAVAPNFADCSGDHRTPTGSSVCAVCGAPLQVPAELPRRARYHSTARALGVVATIAAVAAGVGILIFAVDSTRTPDVVIPSNRDAVKAWWSDAQPSMTALQQSLYDAESALRRLDGSALGSACQRMHDAAAVDVPTQLPAPDRTLTAELTAAAQDAHEAAHMCLALVEKSTNNYEGEFSSNLDQAEKQMKAAMALVNRTLTVQAPWDPRGKQ